MARINIEDSLYQDRRFMDLYIKLKSVDTALGALIRAWSLAQKWYLIGDGTIPIKEWEKQLLPPEIIDCRLAIIEGDTVRVCGSDDQFGWLKQRVAAGRQGGLAKKYQNEKNNTRDLVQKNGARTVLNRAVKEGKIQKPSNCHDCGTGGCIIEGHHNDYSKPLDVVWLCKNCHTKTHRYIRESFASESKRSLAGSSESKALTLTLTPTLTSSDLSEDPLVCSSSTTQKDKSAHTGSALVELWQKHSGPLPKCIGLSRHEHDKIKERMKENPDVAYWEKIIKKMADNPYFSGANNLKWKADFLWLIEPGNHLKVAMRDYTAQVVEERSGGIDWSRIK